MDFEVDIKKQKRREKIGVVVFIFAILGIFAAVIFYLFASHSLDLAASSIDTNVGQLNGYASIIFEGDNTPIPKEDTSNSILKIATDLVNPNKDKEKDDKKSSDINTEKATIDNVRKYYRNKDATVCKIKCSDYSAYEHGEVFERGQWKIGVLSVTEETLQKTLNSKKEQIKKESKNSLNSTNRENITDDKNIKSETSKGVKEKTKEMLDLQYKINTLRGNNEVDLVIVIAPHQDILDVVDKVDCVICKNVYDDIPEEGKVVDFVYTMRVPETGLIGAILSTPAKMLSANVYSEVEILSDDK